MQSALITTHETFPNTNQPRTQHSQRARASIAFCLYQLIFISTSNALHRAAAAADANKPL